jgi:lysozyme
MAKAPVPQEKPRLSSRDLRKRIAPFGIDRGVFPLVVVGIRGYYKNSMGAPGVNDRGIYDDALFIDTSQVTAAFNGNTDPSRVRRGHGRGGGKGMASLNAGAWFAHKFGLHRGKYLALCQTGGDVTVTRDGNPDYQETGRFGINVHRGSFNATSSLGCQTVHPTQWDSFIALARDQAMRFFPGEDWKRKIVPYVLLEE